MKACKSGSKTHPQQLRKIIALITTQDNLLSADNYQVNIPKNQLIM